MNVIDCDCTNHLNNIIILPNKIKMLNIMKIQFIMGLSKTRVIKINCPHSGIYGMCPIIRGDGRDTERERKRERE